MVACIFGTTRSALSMRSKQLWLRSFVLGNGANLLDVLLDIRRDQLAIAAHPALKIDTVVVVANATDARRDLFTVLSETLVLTTGRCEGLRGVLQAQAVL